MNRQVIKQGEFVSVIGVEPTSGMRSPTRSIKNGEEAQKQHEQQSRERERERRRELAEMEREHAERQAEWERVRAEQSAELEELKARRLREADEIIANAKAESARLLDESENLVRLLREGVEKDCVELRRKAEEQGYADGYAAGEKPGYDDGYAKGQSECREALAEIKAILERIPAEKEKIFQEHENQLFDLIFTIANKITVGSLGQKDKSVISKMLREAAKSFRGSSFIKVSLSKLDIEESVNVDLAELAKIFGENQQVEFEVLKDAPKGTLILDNDSEISDAGIQTQLKMIENLGKGKFKHKPPEDKDEADESE